MINMRFLYIVETLLVDNPTVLRFPFTFTDFVVTGNTYGWTWMFSHSHLKSALGRSVDFAELKGSKASNSSLLN